MDSPVVLGHPLPEFDYKTLYQNMTKISNIHYGQVCDALILLCECVDLVDWPLREKIQEFIKSAEAED